MNLMEKIGNILIESAEYIYSMTSNILCGEEEAPKALTEKEGESQ